MSSIQAAQFSSSLMPLSRGNTAEDLDRAAKAFEAIFLKEIVKLGRGDISKSLFGGGQGEEFFRDFLDEEYAGYLAESGGIGLAELIKQDFFPEKKSSGLNKSIVETDKINSSIQNMRADKAYQNE